MKKRLLAVLALLFSVGTAFSEINLAPKLSLCSSIESQFGFLLYETNNSSWFHTEKLDAELFVNSDYPQERHSISLGAQYLYGKSDRTDFNANLHFGSINTIFSKDVYQVKLGFSAFSVPNSIQILNGKPRFILKDSNGIFGVIGGKVKMYLFEKEWSVSADFLFGNANVASGDMYYFYGKPNNFVLFGGKSIITAPYEISLFLMGGALSIDLDTNENTKLGNIDASIFALFLAKEIQFQLADFFSIMPFVGYAHLYANGSAKLTSANQTYSLFPFKYIGGCFDEEMHFLSAGTSFIIRKGGFNFSLNFLYLFCVKNNNSGSYSYQYKKNLFFDGSSDAGELFLPDAAGSHIFAGILEASYKFSVHKHFMPTIKITKIIAAAILSPETFDFINGAFSSYSNVSGPSSENFNTSPSTGEIVKRALLSGTCISVRIDF